MHNYTRFLSLLFFLLLNCSHFSQAQIISKLKQISSEPDYQLVENNLEINLEGGHIQGIQSYFYQGQEYIYWSGSSGTYAYLVGGKSENQAVITQWLHPLDQKPMKHAGGFQIDGNWLAIGIEDNEARDRSIIQVYKLDNPSQPLPAPVATIERHGTYERFTAGCVAVKQLQQRLLLIVGNWNTRNLDFYEAKLSSQPLVFHLTGTIELANYSREKWVEKTWRSYQNINLVADREELYLLGLAADSPDEDVMDVFSLKLKPNQEYEIRKIFSKTFKSTPDTSFRWGAGVRADENRYSIISAAEKLTNKSTIASYE